MALTCIKVSGEKIVCPEVAGLLRDALADCGRAVLLVPSFAQALDASRDLAAEGGLALGVTVSTPAAWAAERWEVWGDGRRVADATARQLLCGRVLADRAGRFGSRLQNNPGTVALLAELARTGLPWLTEAVGSDPGAGVDAGARPANTVASAPAGVTPAEAELVGLLPAYAAELERSGLVEGCEVMRTLPALLKAAGVAVPPIVAVGLAHPSRAERELASGLAEAGYCVTFVELTGCAGDADRAPELSELLTGLFDAGAPQVRPSGSVRLLFPAGPSAEPDLIAREAVLLARAGARSIVLAAPDARAAFRELAPRLNARGVDVKAQLSIPVTELEPGRAFLEFARTVARLVDLAATWPDPVPVKGGVRVSIDGQDMSWWPPRELSDFMASAVSGVEPARARALDASWRANRLLTPAAVLDQLQSEKHVSAEVAAATRELLRGRLGSAASKLLQPFVQGDKTCDPAADDVRAALGAVLALAKSLKELGVSADPELPGSCSLADLVTTSEDLLSRTKAQVRALRSVPGPIAEVFVADPVAVSRLAPASADALVLCGQTSAESPVAAVDDARSAILASYGVEPPVDSMARARELFLAALRVPRDTLVLERTLFGADGKPAYAGVMLTELLACYGVAADAKPAAIVDALGDRNVEFAGELAVCANASDAGVAPGCVAVEHPAPAGRLGDASRELVLPPPEGVDVGGNVPVLSASQIETYLECPYKWFSLRRLKLSDADAGFGGAEMGTFAHRVLEVTHEELLARAVEASQGGSDLARIAVEDPEGTQSDAYRKRVGELVAVAQADPAARVSGSRVTSANLSEAQRALSDEFDAHLSHMYQLVRGNKPLPQALVPHTVSDLGKLERLRRDLASLLEYESGAFAGYEPRFFEWAFGRGSDVVEYAGVRVMGTVDRIDVDAHGQAAVIDYKHKTAAGFAAEYDVFPKGGAPSGGFALPRRVQSLVYGQVVRRAHPELKVRSAVYLCTRNPHVIAGAVDEDQLEATFGERSISASRAARVAVPRQAMSMEDLLDACEEAIAARVARLLAGDIEANPVDAHACDFCPVLNCERRIRS